MGNSVTNRETIGMQAKVMEMAEFQGFLGERLTLRSQRQSKHSAYCRAWGFSYQMGMKSSHLIVNYGTQ